nr:hypothetical protein [Tanacetum cinerariifolium]
MDLASQAGQSCTETCGTARYDPPQMIVIVWTAGELVMKYKAEKVCHDEIVKMPLVDLKVLEVYTKLKEEHESHLKMNLELLKKEKCYAKPNKVEVELRGSFSEVLGTKWDKIGESKMIGLEMEQEMTKVVVIKERLKEAKDRVVRFGKKGELAHRFFARLSEENWNLLCSRTWKTFGGNTHDLGSILEETGQEYDFTPKEGLKKKSKIVETVSGNLLMPFGSASDRVRKSCDGV